MSWIDDDKDDSLSPRPIVLQCDACGRDFPVADDEPEDEDDARLCWRCVRAYAVKVLNTPPTAA